MVPSPTLSAAAMKAANRLCKQRSQTMKTIHKIVLGSLAAVALAMATPANAYDHHYHHGHYVYHHGQHGYYYGHAFYPYYGGPYPYYYGPYGGPRVVVGIPAPVVFAPRRRHFFIFF
jgi:hypothetical protein